MRSVKAGSRSPIRTIVVYFILVSWAIWLAFPLYWLLIFAFKTPLAVSAGATYLPFVDFIPTTKAFVDVFATAQDAAAAFSNSVVISTTSAVVATTLGTMAGYGLARFRYDVGKITNEQIALAFIAQRMFPVAVLAVPILLLFRTLNLLDTPIGMIIAEVGVGTPLVAWIVRNFFASLPTQIEDSARIDGCSRLQVLWYFVIPLGAPGIVAAFVLIFIATWNDYFLALVLTFSWSITMPLYIQLQVQYVRDVTSWANVAVISIITMLPPAIVGLSLQRYVRRGLTWG